MPDDHTIYPHSLSNDVASGVLQIVWSDGLTQHLDNASLRGHCQCSSCKSEKLRSGLPLTIAAEIRLLEIRPVGLYGVQLIFSDGHERGIFPWAMLKTLPEKVDGAIEKLLG